MHHVSSRSQPSGRDFFFNINGFTNSNTFKMIQVDPVEKIKGAAAPRKSTEKKKDAEKERDAAEP